MKRITITSIFGIVGILFWALTILLRETSLNSVGIVNFILGIMPNISATWFFIWMEEVIINRLNKDFNFKILSIIAILIFIFAIISEIIHDIFLNSPFDIYDIMVTILAITLYLIISFRLSMKISE